MLGRIVLDFDKFDLKIPGCEAMDINEFNLSNNLIAYDFCEQISWFLPVNHGKPHLTVCFGHSLLRPTSNNLKHVLPEILRCLVPEYPKSSAWVPDSFSSWGLSLERTWLMHEKLFCSCSYPSRHWTALNTPYFTFGLILLYLLEELVHHCHHVSVQINKMCFFLRVVACCQFNLYYLCWLGTVCIGNVQSWVYIKWARAQTSV